MSHFNESANSLAKFYSFLGNSSNQIKNIVIRNSVFRRVLSENNQSMHFKNATLKV